LRFKRRRTGQLLSKKRPRHVSMQRRATAPGPSVPATGRVVTGARTSWTRTGIACATNRRRARSTVRTLHPAEYPGVVIPRLLHAIRIYGQRQTRRQPLQAHADTVASTVNMQCARVAGMPAGAAADLVHVRAAHRRSSCADRLWGLAVPSRPGSRGGCSGSARRTLAGSKTYGPRGYLAAHRDQAGTYRGGGAAPGSIWSCSAGEGAGRRRRRPLFRCSEAREEGRR